MFSTTTNFHSMSIQMDDNGRTLRLELRDVSKTIVKAREYAGAKRADVLRSLDEVAQAGKASRVHNLMWALLDCTPRLEPRKDMRRVH